jgi:hypothetical protein
MTTKTVGVLLADGITTGVSEKTVEGSEKMVQRYLTLFFTAKGSVPGRPEVGTRLAAQMLSGNVPGVAAVVTSFASDNINVIQTMRQDDNSGFGEQPADEQIAYVALLDVSREQDRVLLRLRAVSAAHNDIDFQLQIPVTS